MAKIGWLNIAEKAVLAYPPPTRFCLTKDKSPLSRGFLSCPSMRACFEGAYVIESPFSLQLRAVESNSGGFSIHPVYPFTSIAPPEIDKLIKLQPKNSWRLGTAVIFQIASPYLFVSDEVVDIEMFHPSFASSTPLTWQLIPGRFDIYSWHRPLNFAVEWDIRLGDFKLRQGDPLYLIRFHGQRTDEQHDLIELTMNEAIRNQLRLSKGITAIRRGTYSLMAQAKDLRQNVHLVV